MSVFRSLLGKQDRRRQIKAYVRDDGPIAYGAPLLSGLDPESPLDQALFSAGLCWYWERTLAYATEDTTADPAFPGARPLTLLTATTYPDFVADLKKQRTGEIDRSMRLYGLQPAEGQNFDIARRDDAVRRFVNDGEGALQVICILIRDAGFQNEDESFEGIFVRHEIPDSIRRLLLRLGIDPDQPQESLPYWHLWSTSVEFIFDLPRPQRGLSQKERFPCTGEICLFISTDAERRAFRDRTIAQVQRWVDTLPPGTAKMSVGGDEAELMIDVVPLRQPDALSVYICQPDEEFLLWAKSDSVRSGRTLPVPYDIDRLGETLDLVARGEVMFRHSWLGNWDLGEVVRVSVDDEVDEQIPLGCIAGPPVRLLTRRWPSRFQLVRIYRRVAPPYHPSFASNDVDSAR